MAVAVCAAGTLAFGILPQPFVALAKPASSHEADYVG